jgi:multidrug resistance efflux pump
MIWNTRLVRITVGLLLLAAGVVAFLPTLTGYTSLDGTVNASIGVVSAPIDGVITNNPPKIGTFVPAGDDLVGIRNDRIVRTAEAQIEADLTAAKQRLQALREQIAKLTELTKELQSRLHEFQQASIRNVAQEIAVRQHRISTAAAQQKSADADLVRKQTLGSTGIVAGSSVEQARAASITAQNEGNIAREELERLNQQLDALKRGVFVGEGRNDVPYSQQRMDEVTIQLAEVQFRARDVEARLIQLEAQLEQERTRNRTLRYAMVRMPFDGVIWRTNVVEGSNVIAGAELAQALDCHDLFVDILVSEVAYDEIYPGREAEIRLLGRSEALQGRVISVRGSAAAVDDAVLAAKPPQARGKDARIRVSIPDSTLQSDYANFCQVGRSVQVRFKSRSFPLKHWFYALWFSIT